MQIYNFLVCKVENGETCTFPFKYKGVEYYQCTDVENEGKLWCFTNTSNPVKESCERPTCGNGKRDWNASLCSPNTEGSELLLGQFQESINYFALMYTLTVTF